MANARPGGPMARCGLATRRRGLAVRPLGILGPELAAAALADWLFWDHRVGLSFALFCTALALTARAGSRPLRGRDTLALLVLVLGLAPAVEDLSPLSVVFAMLGTAAAAGFARPAAPSIPLAVFEAATRWIAGPRRICQDLGRRASWRRRHASPPGRWLGQLAWVLPFAAGSIFLALFADANPVIADVLTRLSRPTLDLSSVAPRAVFWFGVAVVVWPVVRPRRTLHHPGRLATASIPSLLDDIPPALRAVLFGDAAVLRALLLCNGLFVLQLALDGVYLWGGVALPHGMSYAEYAHRGAYPLVLTALLAGGFVLLISRREASASYPRVALALLLLFTGQNVLLVGSAARRLGLYVGAYGLTEWRVAAFCWMGLIACGLMLVAAQIIGRRSTGWLVARAALAAAAVLYGWCLADVPVVVARYDVAHCSETTGSGPNLDVAALIDLGPAALPALESIRNRPQTFDIDAVRDGWARSVRADAGDWRAWSFRTWRLARSLDKVDDAAPAGRGDERQAP